MTLIDDLVSEPEGARIFQQERVILEATEMICGRMKKADMSRVELARLLGVTKSNVSQMLDGNRNLTLRSISDAMFHMGYAVHFECKKIPAHMLPQPARKP